jgi:hypothetical protein
MTTYEVLVKHISSPIYDNGHFARSAPIGVVADPPAEFAEPEFVFHFFNTTTLSERAVQPQMHNHNYFVTHFAPIFFVHTVLHVQLFAKTKEVSVPSRVAGEVQHG